jgi:hypothetical protein
MRRGVTFRTNTLRKSSMGNMRRLRISIIRRTFDMMRRGTSIFVLRGKSFRFIKREIVRKE